MANLKNPSRPLFMAKRLFDHQPSYVFVRVFDFFFPNPSLPVEDPEGSSIMRPIHSISDASGLKFEIKTNLTNWKSEKEP